MRYLATGLILLASLAHGTSDVPYTINKMQNSRDVGAVNENFRSHSDVIKKLRSEVDSLSATDGASGVPTGAVVYIATSTVPSYWLEGNGATVTRASYPNLAVAISTTFGVGSGDGLSFSLPDCRGYFIRGWAHGQTTDPDAATRSKWDGTVGDVVGSTQTYAAQAHTHTINPQSFPVGGGGGANYLINDGAGSYTTSSTGGNETRPINIYMMCIIKY